MSSLNRDFITEILEKQAKQTEEVREVKRLGEHFKETDKARGAKQALFSENLKELRGKVSSYFLHPAPKAEV